MERLADLILFLHAGYVLFVVGGLALILLGVGYGWRWARSFWFRALHLAAVSLVAVEALLGVVCPLTVLEDWLRSTQLDEDFVVRWVRWVLFWDFPLWVFTLAYLILTLVTVLTWWRWPPAPRGRLAAAR
jgi:polyferredoxin